MELPAADARESRGLRSRVKIDLDFLLCLPTVLTAIDRKGRVRCVAAFCGNQVEQAKSPVATLRFVGIAVDEVGMAVDKRSSITYLASNVRDVSFTVAYHRVATAWRY